MVNLLDNVSGFKQVKSYMTLLDDYKRTLEKYQKKVDALNITEEDQMAAVQVALDLTYLKEELEGMKPCQDQLSKEVASLREMLEEIAPTQKQITEKIEGIDTTIIEPVKKNYTANRTAINEKLDQVMEVVGKKGNGMRIALILSLILNVLTTGGLVFVILYMMGVIVI